MMREFVKSMKKKVCKIHSIADVKNCNKQQIKTVINNYLEPDIMIKQLLSDFPITVVQSR